MSPSSAVATQSTKQLLVDVSVLAHHDARSGIQRVTKALLGELMTSPPSGYAVRTVQASRWQGYRYLGGPFDASTVRVRSGDVFLGLDLASRILPRHRLQLLDWRAAGGRLCFVMYDLLPHSHPDWFTRRNCVAFRRWIRTVAVHADAVACISQCVARQFSTWLTDQGFDPELSPDIRWFHLGAHLPSQAAVQPLDGRIAKLALRPFLLMVGTIEPRKGYAETLDAFEEIWRDGDPMQLVIVGRVGWKTLSLVNRLRAHAEAGRRLHWFDNADDLTLHTLYAAASGVLVASEAEGFGLPIFEAALHGKPLLIRDLPVFREVARAGATYFQATTSSAFARELLDWFRAVKSGTAIPSKDFPIQSWADSAHQLLSSLLSKHGANK
jgi:glycosyltransferase involved in cell wall biosynthesis